MKIVTSDQMRDLDRRAGELGLSGDILMANAGLAVAQEVNKWLGGVNGCRIIILVGPGNNGGDGLVVARHLHDWGARVNLQIPKTRAESDPNYRLVQQRNITVLSADQDRELEALLLSMDVVIDSFFGTGKARPLDGIYKHILDKIQVVKQSNPRLKCIALDIPSGLDPDTGSVDSSCFSADFTVTLANPKKGLFSFPGAAKVGELIVADIGIPPTLSDNIPLEMLTSKSVKAMLGKRPLDANKGTFGKVLVVAGSINYVGAAYLACTAATRVGAGLVTLATPCSIHRILASKLAEVTYIPLPECDGVIDLKAVQIIQERLPDYDVLLLGCGLGQSEVTQKFVRKTLFSLPPDTPLVVDADGLNSISGDAHWWKRLPPKTVFTPHPGEMARLADVSTEEIQSARLVMAQEKAISWQKTVVLKGAHTIIAAPDGNTKISGVANPGLASAGTGDILSGAIAGLMAQGLTPCDAAACGVYLHGMAGEIVRRRIGDMGMVASDLLPVLPLAIKEVKEGIYVTSN